MPIPFTSFHRSLRQTVGTGFLLLAASASVASPQTKASSAVSPTAAFERVMKDAYPADKPGAAVIVVKDGKTLFRKAYGMADLELGVPLQPDMVFRLGSITKQFTATAILMLAEEGKLNVQDRIEKHLPGYPTHGHTITIEHLLTHTSGIQSYTGMPGWMTDRITAPMKPQEIIDGFKKEPMNFAPGERYAYNNSGYILLGAIIEKVSGKTYEAFVKERIFDPLGMTSSYYGSTEPIIKKRVPGYSGDAKAPVNARYLSMTQPYAAGSLASTVDDLARWDQALAASKLIKPESLAQAWKPFVLKSGEPTTYGYGWVKGSLRGRRSIEHGGGIFGFSTYALSLPDDRVYVAVLCNSDSPATDPGYVARKLAALGAGDPFPEWTEVKLDNSVLERYAGLYQIDANNTRTVTVAEGRLYTQRSGGGQRLEARASSQTEFFYPQNFTHFTFVLDASGRATEMLMHQDGAAEAQRAPRVADAPKERPEVQVAVALLNEYLGDYELGPGFVLAVTREGDRLMTQATGQQKIEVFASSDTEFFPKVIDARIVFTRSTSGAVDGLVLHQAGREMKARKVKE
ncbi:MAG: serine hydrolase [Vicinamibacteria bacterium]|nr:serine hydrolase [Vicinamibacteria bacterium]